MPAACHADTLLATCRWSEVNAKGKSWSERYVSKMSVKPSFRLFIIFEISFSLLYGDQMGSQIGSPLMVTNICYELHSWREPVRREHPSSAVFSEHLR